jgi:hypothetical protein
LNSLHPAPRTPATKHRHFPDAVKSLTVFR